MRLKVESRDDDFYSVVVVGDVTQNAFGGDVEPLAQALGEDVYKSRLLLGLQEATYMDSRGVGWLLRCHRRFRQSGGVFVVHSIPANIQEVLDVLHLDGILILAEDETSGARQSARDGRWLRVLGLCRAGGAQWLLWCEIAPCS